VKIDYAIVTAIMALFGLGLPGIIQTLKNLFHLEGLGAYILAGACSIAATAVILAQAHVFTLVSLALYALVVFGEVTGLYKLSKQ
jgi:hypothetical protein